MKQPRRRTRAVKPPDFLAEEIAAAEAKLKALKDQQKEHERRYTEKNQKAILALLKEHELDRQPIGKWQLVVPALRDLLAKAEEAHVSENGG